MNFVYNMVTKLEKPAVVSKIKKVMANNKPQTIAFSIFIALIYLTYVTLSIQGAAATSFRYEEILHRTFWATIGLSAVISILFIYLTKDKLKSSTLLTFFYNSRLKAHHFIIGSYFIIFLFHGLLVILAMFPIPIINYFLFGTVDRLLYFTIITFMSITIVFFTVLLLWMWSTVLSKHAIFHYALFIFSLVAIGALFYQLFIAVPIDFSPFTILILLVLMVAALFLEYRLLTKVSNFYLVKHFRERENASSAIITKPVDFHEISNGFFKNSVLEIYYLFRSRLFGEQIMLYVFLMVITVFLYNILSFINFMTVYSMIVNFGLIEIMILLPLMMGTSYFSNKIAIYNLNMNLYDYLLSRCAVFLLINGVLYVIFTSTFPLLLDIPYSFTLHFIPKVLFVTVIAILLGYVFPLNQFNKLFLMLGTVFSIGLLEIVLLHVLENMTYVSGIYLVLSIITFFGIVKLCMRRPVVR